MFVLTVYVMFMRNGYVKWLCEMFM